MRRFIIALCALVCLVAGQYPAMATVNSSTNKTIVLGNGSQTQFSFSFIGVATAYISVLYTDGSGNQTLLSQGNGATQYQITLNPVVQGAIWGMGGTVTYNPSGTPIPNGSTLTIFRTLPLTQAVTLQNMASIAVLGKGAETGLDTGVMQGQQISEQASRSIVANIANSAPPLPLPPAAQLANQGICGDGTGLNLVGCAIPSSGIISTAMQPVVDAASLAAGRTAFGLGSAAVENVGSYGLQDDGAGNLRQNYIQTSDATNQTVTGSYHQTQRICTGPIAYGLNRANTLWNGFAFKVYAVSGVCTITPNANDNFQGMASGVSIAIPQGSTCLLTTNAASSGLWQADCNGSQPGLSASSNGTALTLTYNGTALPFRDTTLASGDALWATPAAGLSITIPLSATLGTSSSNVPFRVWVFQAYNGGTPVLGVATCSNPTTIFACAAWETLRKSGTGITSGSTAAGTLYTSVGVSNDAVRIIGYADYASGLGTAGTWASAPTTLQLCTPPFVCKRPGDIVQTLYATTTSVQTSSGATFPTVTGFTKAITLTSTVNPVTSFASIQASAGSGGQTSMQIYRATGSFACTTAVAQTATVGPNVNAVESFIGFDQPGTLSSVTYGICFGVTTANGVATSGMMILHEIMGSLDPDNDNGLTALPAVG